MMSTLIDFTIDYTFNHGFTLVSFLCLIYVHKIKCTLQIRLKVPNFRGAVYLSGFLDLMLSFEQTTYLTIIIYSITR